MQYAFHGMNTLYSNIVSDIRIAKEAGYDAMGFNTEKLIRYLDAGFSGKNLKEVLDKYGMGVTAIDTIADVEVTTKEGRTKLFRTAEKLVRCAAEIGVPSIQLNAFEGLSGLPKKEIVRMTARNIKEICFIGKEQGIRFQYEGAAWTPIASLENQLQLHECVGQDNFGFVIDFWHFWASRGATPDDIAKINKEIIYSVHISDGKRPEEGYPWPDETTLRGYLPGEGSLPVNAWADAIKATGYDGFVSGEILNRQLWEEDHLDLSKAMLTAIKKYI